VTWEQRGVVTGTVMFCRFLGQSVGAAIFGAIFNAALAARLHAAPPALAGRLPQRVDQVGAALTRVAGLGRAAAGYLRAAVTAGIHDVYLALALAAVATLAAVLVLVPRRFAMPGAEASAGPAGRAGPAAQAAPAPSSGENPADHGGDGLVSC
jgi:ABC-type transport system involved in cytochrome bd biosynthesis fused ATPase/permease subunit